MNGRCCTNLLSAQTWNRYSTRPCNRVTLQEKLTWSWSAAATRKVMSRRMVPGVWACVWLGVMGLIVRYTPDLKPCLILSQGTCWTLETRHCSHNIQLDIENCWRRVPTPGSEWLQCQLKQLIHTYVPGIPSQNVYFQLLDFVWISSNTFLNPIVNKYKKIFIHIKTNYEKFNKTQT